jgi:phage terminase large subunit
MIFKRSGQKILFRGMDDPNSITSITVEDGDLCWAWWEEAFQIEDEGAFNMVDMSLRGILPSPLFIQHRLTKNPWSDKHWIKKRFFDNKCDDTLAITRNYDCNEFISPSDISIFERMRIDNPRRYAIEGLGEWGISEGLIFENWEIREFSVDKLRIAYKKNYIERFGLDFGFSNDPTAFVHALIDEDKREIYIASEIYRKGMLIDDIYQSLKMLGYDKEEIIADSAQPGTIAELKKRGLHRIKGAKKGQDSVRAGIARLQDFKIFIHPRCTNAIVEFSNYVWQKDRMSSRLTSVPIDDFNHIIDALRYCTEDIGVKLFRW